MFALLAIIAWILQGYHRSERSPERVIIGWMIIAIVLTLVVAVFWILSAYQAVKQ